MRDKFLKMLITKSNYNVLRDTKSNYNVYWDTNSIFCRVTFDIDNIESIRCLHSIIVTLFHTQQKNYFSSWFARQSQIQQLLINTTNHVNVI